jgi:hypothetical protein
MAFKQTLYPNKIMNHRKQIVILLNTTLIIIAVAPILYLNQIENVPFKAFILGTGSWGIGLIMKMIAHQLVVVQLHRHNASLQLVSVVNGFLSGLFELSAAVGIILIMKNTFVFDYKSIISFGLAIGSFESLIVAFNSSDKLLNGTALEKTTKEISQRIENMTGTKQLMYSYFYPILERILSTFIHISTRGLVFVAIFGMTLFPIVIAIVVFIVADGLLGYYFNVSGKLLTDKGFFQFYKYLLVLTVFVTGVFLILISPFKEVVL